MTIKNENEIEKMNEIVSVEKGNLLEQQDLGSFYSMSLETKEDKIKLFNAINNPDDTIAKNINKTIVVKDLLIEMVELTNEDTGEVDVAPRIIVIDIKGKTYSSVSFGMLSAFQRIIKLFGEPTWKDGIPVVVKQVSTKNGSMLTVELV